jgi:hypothetical protein
MDSFSKEDQEMTVSISVALSTEYSDYAISGTLDYVKTPSPDYGADRPGRLSMREKTNLLVSIFALQRSEGGLELNETVAKSLGVDLRQIRRVSRRVRTDTRVNRTVLLHTVILLSVLEAHFQSDSEIWQEVLAKTSAWLDRVLGKMPMVDGEDVLDWAKSYVRRTVRI